MPTSPTSKVWFAAGASLAVSGGFAILTSLPEGGPMLWAGIGLIAAGSLALRMGLAKLPQGQPADGSPVPQEGRADGGRHVEAELVSGIPRTVRITLRGKIVAGTWMLVLAVFGLLAHQHFGRFPRPPQADRLEAAGRESEATVHSLDERHLDGGQTLYFIGYSFTTQAGNAIRISSTVPERAFGRLALGEVTRVLYAPGNPELHFLPDVTSPVSDRFVFFIGGLLLAAAGVAEAQRRLHRRLVATGSPAAGFVADVRRRGGVRSFRVNYDVEGNRHSLRGSERNPNLQAGQRATVLYNPEIPTRAVIYRLALYRALNQSNG